MKLLLGACVLVAFLASPRGDPLQAAEKANAKSASKQEHAPARPDPLAEVNKSGSLAAQYCAAVRDTVAEARFASQAAQLEALARQVDERLMRLDERSAELKSWIEAREAFMSRATTQLVGIYANMRPEAASEQLVRLEPATAASIIAKLEARTASAILNDMPPEKAARLTSLLAGAARGPDQKSQR